MCLYLTWNNIAIEDEKQLRHKSIQDISIILLHEKTTVICYQLYLWTSSYFQPAEIIIYGEANMPHFFPPHHEQKALGMLVYLMRTCFTPVIFPS